MKTILNSFVFLQLFYIKHVYSTMPIYCLQPLNTSDCNQTPTKVFSYYKSGSRCELEVWRGCPTGNKFDTERECSDSCIFRDVLFDKQFKHKLNAKCIATEDMKNCNEKIVHGFKYDELLIDCVEVATNCPGNIFEEKLDCIDSCVRDLTWEEKLKLITEQQSKELDKILEEFANTTHNKEHSNTTTDVEAKTTHSGVTDDNENKTTSHDDGGKKLHGDVTTTNDNKTDGGNSTSGHETGTMGTGGTSVSEHNSNTTGNSEGVKETTAQNIVTTSIHHST